MIDDDIQLPNFRTARMTLIDTDPVHGSKQEIKVCLSPLGVSLSFSGYGSAEKVTAPVFITHQRGEVLVYVRADINRKEPTHVISLGRARETNRRQQGRDTR